MNVPTSKQMISLAITLFMVVTATLVVLPFNDGVEETNNDQIDDVNVDGTRVIGLASPVQPTSVFPGSTHTFTFQIADNQPDSKIWTKIYIKLPDGGGTETGDPAYWWTFTPISTVDDGHNQPSGWDDPYLSSSGRTMYFYRGTGTDPDATSPTPLTLTVRASIHADTPHVLYFGFRVTAFDEIDKGYNLEEVDVLPVTSTLEIGTPNGEVFEYDTWSTDGGYIIDTEDTGTRAAKSWRGWINYNLGNGWEDLDLTIFSGDTHPSGYRGTWSASHQYGDNGFFLYDVHVHSYNGDAPTGQLDPADDVSSNLIESQEAIGTVLVGNIAPTFSAVPNVDCETDPPEISLDLSVYDPGSDDISLVIVDWGDGYSEPVFIDYNSGDSNVPDTTPSPEVNPRNVDHTFYHTYPAQGGYSISIRVEDDDGGIAIGTAFVDTNDCFSTSCTSPFVWFGSEIFEGEEFIGQAFIEDDEANGPWTVYLDYGDGQANSATTFTTTEKEIPLSHVYGDDGFFNIVVEVVNAQDENCPGDNQFLIKVKNVDPIILDILHTIECEIIEESSLELTGLCDNGVVEFALKNTGVGPMLEAGEYIIYKDGVQSGDVVSFQLDAGEQIDLEILAEDQIIKMVVDYGETHLESEIADCLPPVIECYTIDFNELTTGEILDDQYYDAYGLTISANNDKSGHPDEAIIFDSADPTGRDFDLGTPNEDFSGPGVGDGGETGEAGENNIELSKVLIIAEDIEDDDNDGFVDDPDDEASGGSIYFKFENPVTMNSIHILDIEERGGYAKTYDAEGKEINVHHFSEYGDNSFEFIEIGDEGVYKMEVNFGGSGAVDDINFCFEETPELPEGECDGKVTMLRMQYRGQYRAQIRVEQKEGVVIFDEEVGAGDLFEFYGKYLKDTPATEIYIYVDGVLDSTWHTSCSVPIGPGVAQGSFEIMYGESRNGGALPPATGDGTKGVGVVDDLFYVAVADNLVAGDDDDELDDAGVTTDSSRCYCPDPDPDPEPQPSYDCSLVVLSFRITDPGSDDETVTINWGDGTEDTVQTYLKRTVDPAFLDDVAEPDYLPFSTPDYFPRDILATAEHKYAENGEYTITITVVDDDDGSGVATHVVQITNYNGGDDDDDVDPVNYVTYDVEHKFNGRYVKFTIDDSADALSEGECDTFVLDVENFGSKVRVRTKTNTNSNNYWVNLNIGESIVTNRGIKVEIVDINNDLITFEVCGDSNNHGLKKLELTFLNGAEIISPADDTDYEAVRTV